MHGLILASREATRAAGVFVMANQTDTEPGPAGVGAALAPPPLFIPPFPPLLRAHRARTDFTPRPVGVRTRAHPAPGSFVKGCWLPQFWRPVIY